MLETLLALLAAHLVADFVLQTDWVVARKRRWWGMALHIGGVAAMTFLAIGRFDPAVLAIIVGSHLVMDLVKTFLMKDDLWPFLIDQAVHLVAIVLTAALFPETVAQGWWGQLPADQQNAYYTVLVGLSGLILAVPLLRGGRAIGVLVVQNRTERVYDEEEVEDLQIIAMVLAEMVGAGELLGEDALKDVEIAPHKPERLKGAKFSDGLAYGTVVLHDHPVAPEQLLSDDAAAEDLRLQTAVEALQKQIDEMLEGHHGLVGAPYEVLETYRMFAHDRGWNRSLAEAVRSGLTAEAPSNGCAANTARAWARPATPICASGCTTWKT